MSVAHSVQPREANLRAASRPMPAPAPVITIVRDMRILLAEVVVEETDLLGDEGLEPLTRVGLEVPHLMGGEGRPAAHFLAALIAGAGGVVWSWVPTCSNTGMVSLFSWRAGEYRPMCSTKRAATRWSKS